MLSTALWFLGGVQDYQGSLSVDLVYKALPFRLLSINLALVTAGFLRSWADAKPCAVLSTRKTRKFLFLFNRSMCSPEDSAGKIAS